MPDPCKACPWRRANHGRCHPGGFHTKRNLTRLWNRTRRGQGQQTCHPTGDRSPAHRAKAGAEPRECIGSAVLIMREIACAESLAWPPGKIGPANIEGYEPKAAPRAGLRRTGLLYHCTRLMPEPARRVVGTPQPPPVSADQIGDASFGRPDEPAGVRTRAERTATPRLR